MYLIIFVIACFVLIKSGGFLVKILIMLSRYFKLTEYVFSFVLMAFATSVPELFVGITSGIRGLSNISLGNIIGANLINLTLTLGIIVIVSKGLKIQSKIAKKDAWIVLFISLLPLLLLFDKNLSRGEGVLLVLVFAWYIYRILKDKDAFHKRMDHMKRDVGAYIKLVKNFLYFFIAFIFLIISSLVVVETAKLIAIELYLPLALVGIILVAIGTSLPELVFGVRAAVTKHEGLSLGTLIGSIVVNSTFILGLVAIIHPIQLESLNVVYIGGFFMIVSILLVNIFISSKEKISWKQGLFLILFYVAFLIVEFLFRG
ncbi:MAG: sodium:calcium antiporter [Patescibacteria group bacterium]